MTVRRKISWRIILLLIIALGTAVFLCVDLMRDDLPPPKTAGTVYETSGILNSPQEPQAWVSNGLSTNSLIRNPSKLSNSTSTVTFFGLPSTYEPQHSATIPAYRSDGETFGVVNLDRIISALEPGADSTNARERLLPRISRVIAFQAYKHRFTYVFDISAKSRNETMIFPATSGAQDITDEILADLSP
jgi:hypothetical protein